MFSASLLRLRFVRLGDAKKFTQLLCLSIGINTMWGAFVLSAVGLVLFIRFLLKKLKLENLHVRPVFITGCDSGFGKLLAERLDSKGVPVYAGCLLDSSLKLLEKSCSSRLKTVKIDVTSTESINAAAETVKKDLSGKFLWAIVNNAGVGGSCVPFEWTNKDHCRRALEVNLLGMYDVVLSFLPLVRGGKQGRVVNMASADGRFTTTADGYPISKFAIEGFSDGLSFELDPYNISVHVIEPGFFKTPLTKYSGIAEKICEEFENLKPELRDHFGGEKFLEIYLGCMKSNLDAASAETSLVVDAYEHALFAKFPNNRYSVGIDSHFVVLLSYFPICFQKLVFKFIAKVTSYKTLPPPMNIQS